MLTGLGTSDSSVFTGNLCSFLTGVSDNVTADHITKVKVDGGTCGGSQPCSNLVNAMVVMVVVVVV